MKTIGAALLFLFGALAVAASDFYLRVGGYNHQGGATATSWDVYGTVAMLTGVYGVWKEVRKP